MSEIYAEFIAAELKAENDRRESVHTRATAAMTSAVALVTLAVAVFGYVITKNQEVLPVFTQAALAVAVTLLIFSGGFAVMAQIPIGQKFAKDTTIQKMLDEHRGDSDEIAHDAVTYINAESLVSLRRGTTWKVSFLFLSGVLQILAMLAMGLCIESAMPVSPRDSPTPTTPPPCCIPHSTTLTTQQPQPDTDPTAIPTTQPQPTGPLAPSGEKS